jgi:hypothetical protein
MHAAVRGHDRLHTMHRQAFPMSVALSLTYLNKA